MHQEVKTFLKAVKRKFPWKFRNKRVLEAGSQNINGSPRKYFWLSKEYVGIDIMPGKGVDKVINVINYQKGIQHYPLKRFDTVVSTEMLEHDENWQQSLVAMYNLLETGGLLIITCAGPHRQEHGTRRTTPNCSPATPDYYRNISVEDFESRIPILSDDSAKSVA